MYQVKVLRTAKQDLFEINIYLKQFSNATPEKFFKKLYDSMSRLSVFPEYGVKVKTKFGEFRQIVVSDYLVFYSVDKEKELVEIKRIIHDKVSR